MTVVVAIAVGLVAGALSALGQGGPVDALANSISTWLVAPFVVGTVANSRGTAAAGGVATCAFQLVGYYLIAPERATGGLVAFWTLCAVVGGPLFGFAGHVWRNEARGFGMAVLAGVFIAEGAYAYLHQQDRYLVGVVWIAIGLTLAARFGQLRWLALTVPVGIAGEAILTATLNRFF